MEKGKVLRVVDVGWELNCLDVVERAVNKHHLSEHMDRILKTPIIVMDNKSKTGSFRYLANGDEIHDPTILLHKLLWDFPKDLESTFLHEIAHFLQRLKFGRRVKPHGWEWKSIMRDLEQIPNRCGSHSKEFGEARNKFLAENHKPRRRTRQRRTIGIISCTQCSMRGKIFRRRKFPIERYRCQLCGGKVTLQTI